MKSARWLPLLALLSACASAAAQNSPPAELPKDPKALMQLAWQQNGLHDASLKPWHIHVAWQTVDGQGRTTAQGTWEEWWAGESQYRIVYDTAGFHQTWWATPGGYFTSGDSGWPPWIFTEIESVITPLRAAPDAKASKYKREQKKFGAVELQCLSERDHKDAYCFNGKSPAIRAVLSPPVDLICNEPFAFQDRIVPRKFQVFQLGLGETTVQIDSIELLTGINDTAWMPPHDAMKSDPRRPENSGDITGGRRIAGDFPELTDRAGHIIPYCILGLDEVVGADGRISRLEVTGATPALDQAGFIREYEKSARYRPAMYHGKPIAARITEVLTMQTH